MKSFKLLVIAFYIILASSNFASARELGVAWGQASGPVGGVVNRMITVGGEAWASLYSGGIFRFTGQGWEQIGIFRGLPENRALDIAADPQDSKIVYAAQLVACGAKTVNAGRSWQGFCDTLLPKLGFQNYSSRTLVLDPLDHNRLILAGANERDEPSVVASPDGGKSWELLATWDEPRVFTHMAFFGNDLYLATEANGILRSPDNGKTWTPFNNGLKERQMSRLVADEKNGKLFLATGLLQYNVRGGGSVYVLERGGNKWKPIGPPKDVTSIALHNGLLHLGTYNGEIWRRAMNGGIKRLNPKGVLPTSIFEMTFTNDALFAAARGYGIYRSADGGVSFTFMSQRLFASATREVAVNPLNGQELYTMSWDRPGIYYSKDGGSSFTVLGEKIFVSSMMPSPKNFGQLYVAGDNAFYGVAVKDKTSKWYKRAWPGPKDSIVKTIAIDPNDAKHLLVGIGSETAETPEGYGAYSSRDGGKSWKKTTLPQKAIYSLLFNLKNPKIAYAAVFTEGVYKSADGGDNWRKLEEDRLKYTYRLAISAGDPNVLLASSNLFFAQLSNDSQLSDKQSGIFQTFDGGASWKEITASIRNYGDDRPEDFDGELYNFGHMPNYEQMLIDPKNPQHLIVGHHGENVFTTDDGGETWKKQSKGMIPGNMHNYAYCLGADVSFTTIYACTCGRGLFKGKIGEGGVVAWTGTAL